MDSSDMITKIASYSESFVTLRTFVVTISLMYDRDVAFELEICSESFVTLRTFVDIRPRSKHRWRPRKTKDIYLEKIFTSGEGGRRANCDALAFGDACGRLPSARASCVRDLTRAAQ